MPYQCSYYGDTHCATHQLPENHNCPATSGSSRAQWAGPPSASDSRRAGRQTERSVPEAMDTSDIRSYGTADGSVGASSPDVALNGSVQQNSKASEARDCEWAAASLLSELTADE